MTGLPHGWDLVALTDIAEVRLGRQRSPKNHEGDQMRPYIRAANVTWNGLDLSDVKSMNFSDAEMVTYRMMPGDLVLSEASGSPGEVGKPALWTGEIGNCGFQNTLIRVRPRDRVEPRYLLHYFRAQALMGRFVPESRGVGINHLGRARLAGWATPLPPLSEQLRIVEILEDHLSRLDEADALLATSLRRIAVLDEAAIVRRLGIGSEVAAMLSGVLPNLAPGWTWSALGDVADVVGGITKDAKKQSDPSYVEVPYLRVANVQRARLDLDKVTMIRVPRVKAEALRLQPGDVLMNEGGDRDKLARGWVWEGQIEGCIHQNHVFRARPHEDAIRPEWLSWCANTYGARWAQRNGKQSVNLASISLRVIREMPVPVPPVEVQDDHLTAIRESVHATSRLRSELEKARMRGANLRVSLFAAAFSGQMTGRSSDLELAEELSATLDVEPASLVGHEEAALW